MGMASLFGTGAMGISEIAVAAVIGMGCMIGADTIRDTAILACPERKRQTSDEQYRENAGVDAFVQEVEAEQVRRKDDTMLGITKQESDHTGRLRRERQKRSVEMDVSL